MDKTIEELAKQYAEYMCPAEDYSGSVSDEVRNFDMSIYIDDTKLVLEWFFNKPLAQRLTDTEKEMVRKEYANTHPNDLDCGATNIFVRGVLERVFGKDFFKEDKL